jgi:hypothetical protein
VSGREGPVPADPATSDEEPGHEAVEATPLATSRGSSMGALIGGILGATEQQVFGRRPPAIELVRQAAPVRGVAADGSRITIELPVLDPAAPDPAADPAAPDADRER